MEYQEIIIKIRVLLKYTLFTSHITIQENHSIKINLIVIMIKYILV